MQPNGTQQLLFQKSQDGLSDHLKVNSQDCTKITPSKVENSKELNSFLKEEEKFETNGLNQHNKQRNDDRLQSIFEDNEQVSGVQKDLLQELPEEGQEEWEELESEYIAVDYTKIQEINKLVDQNQQPSLNGFFLQKPLLCQNTIDYLFPKIQESKQSQQEIQLRQEQEQQGQIQVPENIFFGISKTEGKSQWYESKFWPVVGTSLYLECDTETKDLRLLGTNESMIRLNKKYYGSNTKVPIASIVHLEEEENLPESSQRQKEKLRQLKKSSINKKRKKQSNYKNDLYLPEDERREIPKQFFKTKKPIFRKKPNHSKSKGYSKIIIQPILEQPPKILKEEESQGEEQINEQIEVQHIKKQESECEDNDK